MDGIADTMQKMQALKLQNLGGFDDLIHNFNKAQLTLKKVDAANALQNLGGFDDLIHNFKKAQLIQKKVDAANALLNLGGFDDLADKMAAVSALPVILL